MGPRWVGQLSKTKQDPKWMENVEFMGGENENEFENVIKENESENISSSINNNCPNFPLQVQLG